MAETESSANTFMIVSARSRETERTVMLSGFGRVDRHRVGDDDPGEAGVAQALQRLAGEDPCVTNTQTSVAPCSFSASAPAISVPPVVDHVVADDARSCRRRGR